MKAVMKKMMAIILIAGALQVILPAKKAEAGILAVGITLVFVGGNDLESPISSLGAFIAIGGGVLGILTGGFGQGIFMILDQDGNMAQDQMVQNLSERYNFINNAEVINSLAKTIKSKFPAVLKLNNEQAYYVSLSETETKSALVGADLSEEEIAFVVNDLK